MRFAQTSTLKTFFMLLVAVFICYAGPAYAQDASNKRGFQPGGSYAIGDLETINTTNGNLIMNFPLASLPIGRGGLRASINLIYNSKLYDSETAYFRDENEECHLEGDAGDAVLVCPYFQKQVLKASEDGGWHYGMNYSLKLIDRQDQFAAVPSEQRPQCWSSGPWSTLTPGYYEMRYRYKLMVVFPDGSSHEMRPNGWSDGNANDAQHEYFDIRPDGFWDTCNSSQWYTGTITYYSIDGSFLRLDIQHRNVSATEQNWTENSWTLYMPDGSRVTGGGPDPQRIYDRNGNYVTIQGVENYNNTGHYAAQIVDQMGRSITFTNDGTDDLIISQGVGDTLTWKVRWTCGRPQKYYWPCSEVLNCAPQVQQQDIFGQPYWVVDTITLPTQAGTLAYSFDYNAPDYEYPDPYVDSTGWGELSRITLPTGAYADYQYAQDGTSTSAYTPDVLRNAVTSKVLTYNREYDGNSSQTTETWTYGIDRGSSSITGPDGGTTTQAFVDTQGGYWNSGQVYKTVNPDGSKTETVWAWNNLGTSENANAYPKTQFTSIKNAGGTYVKTAIKDFQYDKNGNVTRVAEYDWVPYEDVNRDSQGWPTGDVTEFTPTRITISGYAAATPDASQSPGGNSYVYWSSGSPNLRNAVAWSEVRNASNQPLTRTEITYDNALTTGNVTAQTSWDSTKGSYSDPLTTGNSISVSSQYSTWSSGATGKLTQTTDARGTVNVLTYGSINGYDLYPTQTQIAYGTSVQRTETHTFDFGTGLVTSVTDADNNITNSTTYDVFGRPTLVKAADGKSEETRTTTEYSDTERRVIVRSDLNSLGDGKLVAIQHFDQLGRVRLIRQLEDASTQSATDETAGIKVQTRYAFSGSNSYVVTSNPHRANYSTNAGSEVTMGWTRSKSDNGGRLIEVETFGGTILPPPWNNQNNEVTTGKVTTAYDAEFTTVTDQAGKVRRSMTDGLGRLARVDEPNGSGSLGATSSPNQATSYAYDPLGNLNNVYQGSQTRTFVYSSLSRLTSATNPESGMISYTYQDNGNLLTKTDARSITTTYSYDVLNRVTGRDYSDSTPDVTYTYDTVNTYGKGRLTSVSSDVSSYSYSGYDALGRALGATQTIGSQSYSISNIAYDRAGHVTSMTYPSGHTVTNTFDNGGRLYAFAGRLGDNTLRTYSTGIAYAPGGQMAQEQFGTTIPIYNKLFYNSRGQLAEIRAGLSGNDTSWQRGAIINFYDTCWGMCAGQGMPNNNGNLKVQQVYIPQVDNSTYEQHYDATTQYFEYDSLNRLQFTNEASWRQQYVYDRYGNRTIDQNLSNTYGDGILKPNFAVDTTNNNNRLIVPSGYSGTMHYDAAGNLDVDTYSAAAVSRLYDAENRMTKETQASSYVAGEYSYDGDGRRVKRKVGTVETWQVYGLGGELIAEYAANASYTTPQKEYGYRNGQLLITATCGSGYGDPPTLHDNPLVVSETTVQARHITELRTAINTLRAREGMSAYSWQTSATTSDWITAGPIAEMRTALNQALGPPPSGYSSGLAQGQPVKAVHIQELRDRLMAVWSIDIRWMVTDQLGTPRMIFDQSGSLATVSRHDYLPFGEEVFAGTGGRTTTQGYRLGDGTRQQFTSQERDDETGLDYFLARYYSSTQGRFTSTDEFSGGPEAVYALGSGHSEKQALPYADIIDPQSLNKYQYVFNNPLAYVDPDGHEPQEPQKPQDPGIVQGIIDNTKKIIGTLLRNFERGRDQVPQEEERRGPLNIGDKQIQTYMDEKGRAMERAMDVMEYGDFTGLGTTYRGVATGDRTKTVMGAIGMALHVAPALKPVSSALEKVGLHVLTNKAGVMTAEGTASQAGKLFNLLRGGNKVEMVKPGVFIAKSAFGKGYVTFRTAAASQSKMVTVDFYYIQGALKKIHLKKP